MSEQLTDDMALIEEWKAKFQASMDENVSLKLEGNPELDLNRLRENYMLEKLATIYVGTIHLGRRVKDLEEIIGKSTD